MQIDYSKSRKVPPLRILGAGRKAGRLKPSRKRYRTMSVIPTRPGFFRTIGRLLGNALRRLS